MTYHFDIEPVAAGQYRVVIRVDDGSLLLQSTPLCDAYSATHAIHRLRGSLSSDWRYKIIRRGGGSCSFVIQLAAPRAACVSREFTSCDAMEREIARLKAAACTTALPKATNRVDHRHASVTNSYYASGFDTRGTSHDG